MTPKNQRYTSLPLDAKQDRAWIETRVTFLARCPAFAHLFYTMLNPMGSEQVAVFTRDVQTAATDGASLLLNPDTFFEHPLMERVFILGHEVAHCMFEHVERRHAMEKSGKVGFADGTSIPFDARMMNEAEDLVINDLLVEAGVGRINKDWLHDKSIATGNDSAVDVFRKLYEKQKKSKPQPQQGQNPGQGGQGGPGNPPSQAPGPGRFDDHVKPGQGGQGVTSDEAASERNPSEWKTQIAAAKASAKAQGKLPANLERLFDDILEPKVAWEDLIHSFVSRKIGSGGYDWRKPDRRMIVRPEQIVAPGRTGFGSECVVIAADTSGSIGQKTLNAFLGEVSGVLEDVNPKRLVLMWCDAKVHAVDEVEDAADIMAIRRRGAGGGGGTDFRPVFREIAKMGLTPDALIYLTDGHGRFPEEAPPYEVLWGSIDLPAERYPFGEVVMVPDAD